MVMRCPKCSIIFSSSIHKLDDCPYCGEKLVNASLEKDSEFLDSHVTCTKKSFVDIAKYVDDRQVGVTQEALDELIEKTEKEVEEIQNEKED